MWWMIVDAEAGPIERGERLEWAVEWMGMQAGTAWARVRSEGQSLVFEAGCDSAGMVERLYPVHDVLTSWWTAERGSSRYTTRFREGRFQQDLDMSLGPEVVVQRHQRFDTGWRRWEDRYTGSSPIEDPVSAFFRLRLAIQDAGETVRFPLFTGSRTVTLRADISREAVDGVSRLRAEVATEHEGDVKGKMTVHFSDDADRVPVRVTVQTRAGPVSARLLRRELPAVPHR